MTKVIGYIDGFNLYFGLRSRGWSQYYWLDPHKLIRSLLAPEHRLIGVKYFTARVQTPDDKRKRQTAFLDAVNAVSESEVILGKFYRTPQRCRKCKATWHAHEEKMTDSAIASHLVADALRDQFDTAYLIGGDTDIVPAIKMVRRWCPGKRVVVWFPPARRNQEVERHCDDSSTINGSHLRQSLMPDAIPTNRAIIKKPAEWTNPGGIPTQ